MKDGIPQYKCTIQHKDDYPGMNPPGMESVTIRLHYPAADARPNVKEFEVLPRLVVALGNLTNKPSLAPEHQALMEVARRKIIDNLMRGSELPPMNFEWETENPNNAILRVHLYLPKVVTDPSRIVAECANGVSLANQVASHRW